MFNMVKVLKNNVVIGNVRNWDSALRLCAMEVKSGTPKNLLRIIGNRGDELPVKIKHLII